MRLQKLLGPGGGYWGVHGLPGARVLRCAPNWPEAGAIHWQIMVAQDRAYPTAQKIIDGSRLEGQWFASRKEAVEALDFACEIHEE